MDHMVKNPPVSMQHSLRQRLAERAAQRWPNDLTGIQVRYRAGFAYIEGTMHDGRTLPLCRLRFLGALHTWGFAIYLGSRDRFEDSLLPSGSPVGSPEEALDCACGLYFGDPTAWITPSTN